MPNIEHGKDTIIVDLDGTLCNTDHRVVYAQNGEWDEFHSRCLDDDINHGIMDLLCAMSPLSNHLYAPFRVTVMTGRNEKWRKMTNEWLRIHEIDHCVDELFMRPDDCYLSDVDLKLGWIEKEFGNFQLASQRILFALDDRDKVVQAFRDKGIETWQVREGAY